MKSTILVAAAALALGAWALTGCEDRESGRRQPGESQQPETGTRERTPSGDRMRAPTTQPGRTSEMTPATQPSRMRMTPTTQPRGD